MMVLIPHTEIIPIEMNDVGTIMISGTRIPIDTVIYAHLRGDTPQTIHEGFPTLNLDDIYLLIAHYLKHQTEFDKYLAKRDEEHQHQRRAEEARHPELVGLKARLLARLEQQKRDSSGSDA